MVRQFNGKAADIVRRIGIPSALELPLVPSSWTWILGFVEEMKRFLSHPPSAKMSMDPRLQRVGIEVASDPTA